MIEYMSVEEIEGQPEAHLSNPVMERARQRAIDKIAQLQNTSKIGLDMMSIMGLAIDAALTSDDPTLSVQDRLSIADSRIEEDSRYLAMDTARRARARRAVHDITATAIRMAQSQRS